jgi:two-component system, chemotaxis family, chemotaxis protein CheY
VKTDKPTYSSLHHSYVPKPRPVHDRQSSVASTVTKSVLIVDDNASIRQALCELFKREADFEVCGEAENGKVAIQKAQELHPDLIVLDFSMPVMNGFEAARVVKRLMPTVPLIMYSAFGDQFAEHQARLIGFSEVVSKSEHASVLILKARSLLYSTAA